MSQDLLNPLEEMIAKITEGNTEEKAELFQNDVFLDKL
jgi:hypothetical protein